MMTPATPSAPSAATARRWSSEPIPPEAITGRPAARATARVPARSGPSSVPSRSTSVYTTATAPMPAAQPAAHRDRDRRRPADPPHQRRLHRPAGARAVEVDDVQPLRPRRGPRAGDRDRIVAVDGLPVERALQEPDAAAAAQVDGRIDD